MSEGKSRIEVALMPLAIAIVGSVSTYLVTAQQQRSAEIRASTQLESTKELARADRQLKALELFSEKIASTDTSQRLLALSILESVEPQLAANLARSISEAEVEESPVKAAAGNVAQRAMQEALSGTYLIDSGRRTIVVRHLKDNTYQVEEPSGPSPWLGTATLEDDRLRGRATITKTREVLAFDAHLRVDGSVFVSYKLVTPGTKESAERYQVWYPTPARHYAR